MLTTLITIISVNKRYKYCAWDSIENRQQFFLIFQRCCQGFALKVMQFTAIKYYTLTTNSIFYNLDPFITLIFGAVLLNEKIKLMDVVLVAISFSAVVIIVLGMPTAEKIEQKVSSTDYAKLDHFVLSGFVCLVGVPILVAC